MYNNQAKANIINLNLDQAKHVFIFVRCLGYVTLLRQLDVLMGLKIFSNIKTLDARVPILQIKYEASVVEHISSFE